MRQIALIQTLAGRRCEAAVPVLNHLPAIAALKSAKEAAPQEPLRERALMDAAFVLVDRGQRSEAAALIEEQFKKGTSVPALIAALNGKMVEDAIAKIESGKN